MTGDAPSLYKKVVRITHNYLGPAAERFIIRQVQNHLNKEPEELSKEDLSHLIGWIRGAVSLLTEDSDMVEQYIKRLEQLTGKREA
jgi:hypothetical protein